MKTILAYVIMLSLLLLSCTNNISKEEAKLIQEEVKFEAITLSDAPEDATVSLARNFYFVLDGSGSMRGAGMGSGEAKIDIAKRAIAEFVKNVPQDANLGLFVFDDKGHKEVVPLGINNRGAFIGAVNAVQANGGTPLGQAIAQAVATLEGQFKKQLGYGEYRIVVVTDGEATDDLLLGVKQAVRRGFPLYTIGLFIGEGHALRNLSVSYRAADSEEDLRRGLEETMSELPVFDSSAFAADSVGSTQ